MKLKHFSLSLLSLYCHNKLSVRNLVSRYVDVNINHKNDGRYMKMLTYFGIRLLAETIFLKNKTHTMYSITGHIIVFLLL